MQKEDYLTKLDSIVDDESKFQKVERAKRKNAKHPVIKRQEMIKSMVVKHIAKYVPKEDASRLKPTPLALPWVSSMERAKSISKGTRCGQLYPW